MRNCRPIQIAVLLICGALAVQCAAGESGASATGGKTSGRRFAAGLALLAKQQCTQAAASLQPSAAAGSVEAGILLGIAYDCSGNRADLAESYKHVWDRDLDPQEPTPEITAIEQALKTGLKFQPHTPQGKYFEALLAYRLGNYDAGLAGLQAIPAPVAGSWHFYNLLGSIYLRQAKFAEARQALESALKHDSTQADTFYKLGTVQLAGGDVAGATERLQHAVKLRPAFPAANAALGVALLQSGDFSGARASLVKGTSVGAEIYVYLGSANERLGDNPAAIENYRAALARQPKLPPAEFSLGRLLLRGGDAAGAIEHLQKAAQLDPGNAQAQLYLAMALLAAKQPQSSAAAAEQALKLGAAESGDFHDALGTVFQDVAMPTQSLQSFKQAVASDPANENYLRHLAAAQHKAGDGEAAIATLRAGIGRVPASARLNYLLGLSLLSSGASAQALQPLQKAIELEPRNVDYAQSLAVCLAELENDTEALAAFRQVLVLDPNHAPAYLQIGMLQLKVGANAEAEQSFEKALSLDPNYAPAYFRLGKLYYDNNDDARALKLLEKARELDPEWEDTYFLLGMLYKRAGKQAESEQMLATFRQKKNDLQDLRRKTYDLAPDAFDDARPESATR